MQSYLDMWRHYADFKGKTSRKDYWLALLLNFVVEVILAYADELIGPLNIGYVFLSTYNLVIFIPSLALIVRRLNDMGRTWKSLFILLIPGIGGVVLLWWLCKKSKVTAAENNYNAKSYNNNQSYTNTQSTYQRAQTVNTATNRVNVTKPTASTNSQYGIDLTPSTAPGGKIRHITCLCYNAPYINSLKQDIQNYVIAAEQQRGGEITPTSRISFDCFYDNSNLDNPNTVAQKILEFYMQVYTDYKDLLRDTVTRDVQYKDGHTLFRCFVLYENKLREEVKKCSMYSSLSVDRSDEAEMESSLLSKGEPAAKEIASFLLSCASGRQEYGWWYNADNMVRLLSKYDFEWANEPVKAKKDVFTTLINAAEQTNVWEYHTKIKDVAQEELNKLM